MYYDPQTNQPLSNEDKKQALALLQGMIIGKELAKEQKTA